MHVGPMLDWSHMETAVRERFERIEAILDGIAKSQAAADARMDRADARMDRAEARMERAEARMLHPGARFDKRMRGFEKLVQIGMKEIAKLRRLNQEGDEKLNALIEAQQPTEASLRAFLD